MPQVAVRRYADADADAVYRLRRLAFGGPRTPPDQHSPGEPEGIRSLVAELAGRPVGCLRVLASRQFFGGAAVPMGAVASVAVDQGARGNGVATAMLDVALADMRDAGECLSALYPSAPPLYRARGWEQTGVYERLNLPPERLAALQRPARRRHTRHATADDVPAMHAGYLTLASTVDGMLDRDTPVFAMAGMLDADIADVVTGQDGEVLGHLTADRTEDERLVTYDLVAADADTARALLRQLGSWAGQLAEVSLRIVDPAVRDLLLDLPTLHDVRNHPWMLRVVDLPAAVAARGWPASRPPRTLAVDIEVIDEHAPWHAGRRRIVADGDGVRCEPGGSGEVRMHARALGPWYAGSADTAMLRRAGLLTGDTAAAAALDALTGAPRQVRLANSF